jgi:hypothetical protein
MAPLFLIAFTAACLATPAMAGELNGVGEENPLKGASICQFSGLNDDPDSTNPENPGGRTQSYGQSIVHGFVDKDDPVLHPGFLCNPNILPIKDIGKPD